MVAEKDTEQMSANEFQTHAPSVLEYNALWLLSDKIRERVIDACTPNLLKSDRSPHD
jgi:hypothetical protein